MHKHIFFGLKIYRQLLPRKPQIGLRLMSTENDVLFENIGNAGIMTLNRPKNLNALNLSIIEKVIKKLVQWEEEKILVIAKGSGDGKAFCVGGDVLAATGANLQGKREGYSIAEQGYKMSGIVGTYEIPYVALMDGITMGGAVSISVLGSHRIATERTIFSMPETTIGICPDGGATYFFSRLEGKLGLYLTLLSYRLKGSDVLKAGIATHFIDSKRLKDVEQALVQCRNDHDINAALIKFSVADPKDFSLKPHLDKINRCFDAKCVEEIVENLKVDGSSWAQECLETLEKMCPTSLKVTFKALELGSKMNLLECLQMEYRITTNCFVNENYYEGVRALLIDRDQNPKWVPPTLAEVSDKFVDSHFLLLPNEEDIQHESRRCS